MFCEDVVDCCLEVLCKMWVVVWSSVDVDDGVGGVCLVFGLVDLEDDGCCLGDGDVVEEADVEGLFVVNCHVVDVFVIVSVDGVAVFIDVSWKVVVGESDDVRWVWVLM